MPGAELARRYEDLRAAVFGQAGMGVRHGWAVLARSGMAAWCRVVGQIPGAGPRPDPCLQPVPGAVAGEISRQMVHVLAAMLWSTLQASGGRAPPVDRLPPALIRRTSR